VLGVHSDAVWVAVNCVSVMKCQALCVGVNSDAFG